jgi:hypothetical protein
MTTRVTARRDSPTRDIIDLCVPEQELDRPEISSAPIDEGSFGPSQRMRSI